MVVVDALTRLLPERSATEVQLSLILFASRFWSILNIRAPRISRASAFRQSCCVVIMKAFAAGVGDRPCSGPGFGVRTFSPALASMKRIWPCSSRRGNMKKQGKSKK